MKKHYLINFILISVIINLLSVVLHESGHALIYILQGYKVDFHFTQADPISGVKTLFGAAGGLLFNIIFALIFLKLFLEYRNIHLFSGVVANTWFSRLFLYIIKIPSGNFPKDEMIISDILGLPPIIIILLIFIILTLILFRAIKGLYKAYDKQKARNILYCSFLASIISLIIVVPLEARKY